MFVDTSKIAVIDGDNTIYIKRKMDLGTRNAVMDAVKVGKGGDADISIGAYNTALLIHNIVEWEGPAFVGVACTPANVLKLDPDEPIVDKVLARINELNTGKKRDPKASTPLGEVHSTANGNSPAVTMT